MLARHYATDRIYIKLLPSKFPPVKYPVMATPHVTVPTLAACWAYRIHPASVCVPVQTAVLFSTMLKYRRYLRGI